MLAESQKALAIIQDVGGRVPQVGRSNSIPVVTEAGVTLSLAPLLKKNQWRLEISSTGPQTVTQEETVASLQEIIRRSAKILSSNPIPGGKGFNIFFEGRLNA